MNNFNSYDDSYKYSRKLCWVCGKGHGYFPGIINKWHQCEWCGAIYCPSCAGELRSAYWLSPNKICSRCHNKTNPID